MNQTFNVLGIPHDSGTVENALIRMLDVAQSYTHRIDWTTLERARTALAATNAFDAAADAKLKLRWGEG